MEYAEYTTKGWQGFEVRDGTSYPMTDYHVKESDAWQEYQQSKELYANQVKH